MDHISFFTYTDSELEQELHETKPSTFYNSKVHTECPFIKINNQINEIILGIDEFKVNHDLLPAIHDISKVINGKKKRLCFTLSWIMVNHILLFKGIACQGC